MSRIAFSAPAQLCSLLPFGRLNRHKQCSHQFRPLLGLAATSPLLQPSQNMLGTTRTSSSSRSRDAPDSTSPSPPPHDTPFITDRKKYVHVWADGACSMNGRRGARAGLGVWFGPGHHLNVSAPAAPPATNNSAELQAAGRAVLLARDAGFSRVLVHTDSQFVIDCATRWLRVWRRNGWRLAGGGPVKNRPQLEELARAMDGATVKWNFVRGHSDNTGNVEADRLAVAATQTQDVPADTDT